MPVKSEREYRSIDAMAPVNDDKYEVDGYASTFQEYLLFEWDDEKYFERIQPNAFDEADIRDIILQYDHQGPVFARVSNGTLECAIDSIGFRIHADLSRTEKARSLFEDIKAGMITKMSFAFTVAEDHLEKRADNEYIRVIDRIKKVYDCSAVSIPANDTTLIAARDFFNGEKEKEAEELRRRAEIEREREKLALKIKLEGFQK